MGLLDSSSEEPKSKLRRYVITCLALAFLIAWGLWWIFRFYPERKAVVEFMDTVVAGDFQRAYQLWKPVPSYTYQDFLSDWGPAGEFGPVKSYHIETAQRLKNASGVIVVVAVSPYQPFPGKQDRGKYAKTQEVNLWVEVRDKSLGFAP